MAIEIRQFAVTIPAGTTVAAPLVTPAVFPARVVTQIDILFPPGPRGEVGIAVGTANVKTLPYGNTQYLVADDHLLPFPLEQQIDSGSWQITAYNTGMFPHTITVTFYCSLIGTPAASGSAPPIDSGSLGSSGTPTSGNGTTPPPPSVPPPPETPPPVVAPPVVPPGVGTAPLSLPPAAPALPGAAVPAVDPMAESMLVGVPDLGQVWLLDGREYAQVLTQDDLTALTALVPVAVNLSQATHAAIYAAAGNSVALTLGNSVLSGQLTFTQTGGH